MRQIIGLSYLVAIVIIIIAVSVFIATCSIWPGNKSVKSQDGIHFIEGDFSKATALSKKEHKPIFLLAYANYCSACRKMKNEVFSQKEISSFFNKEFINLSVDIESKYGNEMVNKYQVSATPTIIFLDRNEKILVKAQGFQDKEDLLSMTRRNIIVPDTSFRR